jgi:hypothetical protein
MKVKFSDIKIDDHAWRAEKQAFLHKILQCIACLPQSNGKKYQINGVGTC